MHFGITEKLMTDCVSLCNSAGLMSKVSEKNSMRKRWRLPFSATPLSFDAHPGNLREYPHKPYTIRNWSHWPTFLPLIVWIYLHLNFCGGLRKTHLFCNRMLIGRSRSSKVVDFGTNLKGVCDFLFVINSNTVTEIQRLTGCEFFLPHSHLTPSLGVNPFEFLDELFVLIPKTRVLALSVREDF